MSESGQNAGRFGLSVALGRRTRSVAVPCQLRMALPPSYHDVAAPILTILEGDRVGEDRI
jgi:hypothetical protein